jgi:cell division protein FtsZ
VIDENMKDEIRITVIATGFDQGTPVMVKPAAQPQMAIRPRARVLETVGANVSKAASVPAHAPSAAPAASPAPARSEPRMVATQPEFPSRVFNETDLDIPPFLRKR